MTFPLAKLTVFEPKVTFGNKSDALSLGRQEEEAMSSKAVEPSLFRQQALDSFCNPPSSPWILSGLWIGGLDG